MFIPEVDQTLTVELPQEICRAQVRAIVDEDTCIVELVASTVSKTHTFKIGDLVTCVRRQGLVTEVWQAIDPAEEQRMRMLENIKAAQVKQAAEKKAAREAAEREAEEAAAFAEREGREPAPTKKVKNA